MKRILAIALLSATVAHAEGPRGAQGHGPERAGAEHMEPRYKGIPQHGMMHTVTPKGAKPMHTQVFVDRRTHAEIRRDPHVVVFNHVGYRPAHAWNHWYRDWGVYWRVNDWAEIRTVTCEAVNNQTEQLYPVTETRADSWVWNSTIVNDVAGRALDECAAEAGDPAACSLVERECWNSIY